MVSPVCQHWGFHASNVLDGSISFLVFGEHELSICNTRKSLGLFITQVAPVLDHLELKDCFLHLHI